MVKKALIVTTVSGFVPQFEMNNVRILQEMGYEVHYASNFLNVSYGTDNHRLDGTGIIRHQVDFSRSPFRWKELKRAHRQLKQVMEEGRFDLIHCHTPVGAAVARAAARPYRKHGAKVVYTAHGFHFYKGAPLKYWLLFYPAERLLAGWTDVLITVNAEDYERAKRFCKRKRTRVERIPGVGIDTAYWSGEKLLDGIKPLDEGKSSLGENSQLRKNSLVGEIRQRTRSMLGVSEKETVFLSVGELIPRKNHAAVIQAFGELKEEGLSCIRMEKYPETAGDFRYFICGQGVLKEELQRQIDGAGLSEKVQLLGYRKDIRALLYAADVFVFPSLQEGMPVALMEAAAAGVPIVASDIRGNREVAELCKSAGSAVLFTDKESLKHALLETLAGTAGACRSMQKPDETRQSAQNQAKEAESMPKPAKVCKDRKKTAKVGKKSCRMEKTAENRREGFACLDLERVSSKMAALYKEISQ